MGNKASRSKSKRKSDQVDALPFLPVEVWEIVLSYCDTSTLVYEMPSVSKMCKAIVTNVWKIKLPRDYPDLNEEPYDNYSWKDLYLGPHKLFPFMGQIITKATFKELTKTKGAISTISSPNSSCCDIDDYVFQCHEGIFTKIQINYWLNSAIPEHWQKQGFNWTKSVNDYISLFERASGNFIAEDPATKAVRKYRLSSVVKQNFPCAIYYEVILVFDKARSETGVQNFRDAPFTLESITVQSYAPEADQNYQRLVERYTNKIKLE
jgi:hypothetical protein